MPDKPVHMVHEHNLTTKKVIVREPTKEESAIHKAQKLEAEQHEQKRLDDLAKFQTDWEMLQGDDVPTDVLVRLLRRVLPVRPE